MPLLEASQEALDGHAEEERAERVALGDATDLALHVLAMPRLEEVPNVVDQDLRDARLVQGSDDLRPWERVEGILYVEGDGVHPRPADELVGPPHIYRVRVLLEGDLFA